MDVDVMFRPGAVSQAKKSCIKCRTCLHVSFHLAVACNGWKYKAVHCMEIPFVFNNIARCEQMTGGTKEAYALAAKVSDAWISFARSGNPNSKSLPKWPAFDAANTATMHFDNRCEVMPQMDKDLFDLLGK